MNFLNPHQLTKCLITYEDFKDGDFVTCLPCKHFFDPTAIANWLANHDTCPLCRIEVPENDITYEVFYKEPESPPPAVPSAPPAIPIEKSKYVICSKCKKSKYRNNFKGFDKNFKCSGCRKKKNIDIDHEMAVVLAYSLVHC